jgi:hypothetical protein
VAAEKQHGLEVNSAWSKAARAIGFPGALAVIFLLFNIGQTLDGIKTQAENNCQAAKQLNLEIRATLRETAADNHSAQGLINNFPQVNC